MVKHEPFNLCFRVRSPEILKDDEILLAVASV